MPENLSRAIVPSRRNQISLRMRRMLFRNGTLKLADAARYGVARGSRKSYLAPRIFHCTIRPTLAKDPGASCRHSCQLGRVLSASSDWTKGFNERDAYFISDMRSPFVAWRKCHGARKWIVVLHHTRRARKRCGPERLGRHKPTLSEARCRGLRRWKGLACLARPERGQRGECWRPLRAGTSANVVVPAQAAASFSWTCCRKRRVLFPACRARGRSRSPQAFANPRRSSG